MTEVAEPLRGRRSFLGGPLWGHDRTWSGPAPVVLMALCALAARTGVQVRGSTIGGAAPVVWTGSREQFVATDLFDKVRFPLRAGKVRTKEGLIGTIRATADGFEFTVTGHAMARSPRAVASLLQQARADRDFQVSLLDESNEVFRKLTLSGSSIGATFRF